MKVHLLRSPELKEETYRNIYHLLLQFSGPIVFVESEIEGKGDETGHSILMRLLKENRKKTSNTSKTLNYSLSDAFKKESDPKNYYKTIQFKWS